MNHFSLYKSKRHNNLPKVLLACLLCSLGLHLAIFVAFTTFQTQDKIQLNLNDVPTVTLIDKIPQTKQSKPVEYEIDQQQKIKPEKPVESFRKAEHDQKVDQELAPKGDDARDLSANNLKTTQATASNKLLTHKPIQELTTQKPKTIDKKPTQPTKVPKKSIPTDTKQQKPLPSLEQLMPNQRVLNQIAQGTFGDRNRIKDRPDTKIVDEVWLNLQNNLLVSFFRRFHNQIDLVWNYPQQAARNGIQGTLLLKIVINRNGELLDVDILQGSGSEILDFEAIQAVYRAAPFGPLTKHYPHDILKIKAHFNYRIGGRVIYGQ